MSSTPLNRLLDSRCGDGLSTGLIASVLFRGPAQDREHDNRSLAPEIQLKHIRARKDQSKQCRSQPSHSVVLSGMRSGQTRTISCASLFFKDTPCSVLRHAKRDIRLLPRPPQNRQRLRCLSKRDCYDRTIRSRRRKYSTRTAAPRA